MHEDITINNESEIGLTELNQVLSLYLFLAGVFRIQQ